MATLAIQTTRPAVEVLAPNQISLNEIDTALRRASLAYRRSTFEIGYYGAKMRLTQGWLALGYENEEAYRESMDVPRSTWYKAVRICMAFPDLTLADLQTFKINNLQMLLKVDKQLVAHYNWLDEARSLKPHKLAELVTERNRIIGSDKEPSSYYSVQMPFLAKRVVEQTVEAFQHKHDLLSPGQALEFLVVDRQDHRAFIADITRVRQLLRGIASGLQVKANRCASSIDQERQYLQMAQEILDEVYEKEIQASRAGGTRARGKAN